VRALVTGAGGFVGRHLARHLAESGDEAVLSARTDVLDSLRAAFPKNKCVELDVRDVARLRALIAAESIEVVYHLAAITFVPEVDRDPLAAFDANVGGTLGVLEAAIASRVNPKIVIVSTGHLYAPCEAPIDESGRLETNSLYGMSKRHAEELALHYASRGARVVVARPFNHSGPGQAPSFVLPSFARQIAEAEAGAREPRLAVGNLAAVRDFLDVRDVVRAYRLLASKGAAGEIYNIASGEGRSIRSALDALLSNAKIPIGVEVDPARMRAHDALAIVGNAAKLTAATGWKPTIQFTAMVADLLDDARRTLSGEKLARR
jgi:GDP-4-dehydro-6-deoxy-D-mannose reductase